MKKLIILLLCLLAGDSARAGNTHSVIQEQPDSPVLSDAHLLWSLHAAILSHNPYNVDAVLVTMHRQDRMELIHRPLIDSETGGKLWYPALHFAAKKGLQEIVVLLLAWGAHVNMQIKNSRGIRVTPLQCAADNGWSFTVQTLLQNHGNPNIRSKRSSPSLCLAVSAKCSANTIRMLLGYGACIEGTLPYERETALHCAAWNSNANAIPILLSSFADGEHKARFIEERNISGDTALHVAARRNDCKSIAALLDGGANMNALNLLGQTPLQCAQQVNRVDAVIILIARGAH